MNALRSLAWLLALGALGGCSASPWALPDGVLTTAADREKAVVGGIYPATAPDDSCCWVQRRSRFRVAGPGGMTDLAVQIYVPDIPLFRQRPQSMDVTLDGTYRFSRCCFRPGDHTALIPLPRALRDSTQPLDVSLTMREAFVPAKVVRNNPDTRALAVILVGVGYREL